MLKNNILLLSFISLVICLSAPLVAMEPIKKKKKAPLVTRFDLQGAPTIEEYLRRNLVDDTIKQALDHDQELHTKLHRNTCFKPKTYPSVPDYLIKTDISRLMGAATICKYAQEHHYDLVSCPIKKLYHIPGRPFEAEIIQEEDTGRIYLSSAHFLVVAKKIIANTKPYPLAAIQQAYRVIKEIHIRDLHDKNIMYGHDGIVYLIDTEEGSFLQKIMKKKKICPASNRFFILSILLDLKPLDQDAQNWLNAKIDSAMQKING